MSSQQHQVLPRKVDLACHVCGAVFRYRVDKYNHMVRAHEITPEGPPPDDKPSWDSGPPRDVWGPSRPPGAWEERTGNAQMWSAAPTPAEASRQHKKQNHPRAPRAFHQRRTDSPAFSTPSTRDDLSGIKFGHELTTGQLKVLENQTNRTDATKATADHDMQATTTTTSSSRSTKDPSDSSSETPIRTSGTGVPKQCADCKYIFPSYSKLQKHLQERGHRAPQGFVCRRCARPFASNPDLLKHISVFKHYDPQTLEGSEKELSRREREADKVASKVRAANQQPTYSDSAERVSPGVEDLIDFDTPPSFTKPRRRTEDFVPKEPDDSLI